ncbi:MAG TPA: glycosyltransferase [Chitinophagaceae bacterium]|jgi:glycosyltransferase involved in cell wall biosynthesis|nr:glycosyltransferase [Chitinophagaceae bacterium]
MQETCIIIPCYDEADRLDQQAFLDFAKENPPVCFCFVNDGSRDKTLTILLELQSKNPQQFLVSDLEVNRGKAEAVRQGILKMTADKKFRFIGYFDADLATPLSEINNLLGYFNGNDQLEIVFGSRKKTSDNNIRRNIFRHNFGKSYAWLTTSILGLPIYDTQCGAKIIRASTAAIVFKDPFLDQWLFDLEIFCRIKKEKGDAFKQSIKEVVVDTWTEKGDSKISFKDVAVLPYKTLKLFFKYR